LITLPVEYDEQGPDGRLAQVFLDQIASMREARFSLPMLTSPSLREYCTKLLHRPDERRPVGEVAKSSGMSERTMARVFLR
jgi:hypothetical protein